MTSSSGVESARRSVGDNSLELRYEMVSGRDVVGVLRYRREAGAVALVIADPRVLD